MADLRTRLSHPPVRSRPRRDTCHPRLEWRYPGGATAVCTVLALTGAAVATALSGPGSWLPTLGLAAVLTAVAGLPLWWYGRRTNATKPSDTRTPQRGSEGVRSVKETMKQSSTGAASNAYAQSAAEGGTPEPTLWRMRTTVREEPGSLAALCATFARQEIDILALQTHPLGETTVDEFLLRAPGGLGAGELTAATRSAGGSDTWLERADAHDLVDTPTRVLGMAARTALDSSELPLALRELLGRCRIRSLPPASASTTAGTGPDSEASARSLSWEGKFEETLIRLPDPAGGVLVIERPHLAFTPTEFARARALVELDARLGRRLPSRRETLDLPEEHAITVRRVDTRDLPEAKAMHVRCSPRTLAQRYHGPLGDADRYLQHLLSPRFGRTLAVESSSGNIVALGHLLWDGEETEVALLIEDDWQRRGIGAQLLRQLIKLAVEARCGQVYAVTGASNTGMIATMRSLGLPLDYQFEEGTVVISAPLAPLAAAAPDGHR